MNLSSFLAPFGSFPARIPYGVPWAPGVHRLRNKALCSMYEVHGYDTLVSSKHDMWQRNRLIRESVDRLGSQWFFEAHVIRDDFLDFQRARGLRNRTLWLLDDEHASLFEKRGTFFRNRMFLGLGRRHDSSVARLLQEMFGVVSPRDGDLGDDATMDRFEEGVSDFEGALRAAYRSVRRTSWDVGKDEVGNQYILDQTAGLFDEMITGEKGPLAFQVSQPPLVNGVIGGKDWISGDFPELDPEGRALKHAVVSIEGFPMWSIAGVADFLGQLPVANRWWSRYRPMSQSASLWRISRRRLAALNRSGKTLADENPLAMSAARAISQAYSEASELNWTFGFYSGGVVFRDEDEDKVRRAADDLVDMLREKHFKARRESRLAWRALLGSYPFNEGVETRASFICGQDAINWFPLSQQFTGHAMHPNKKYRDIDPNTPAERVAVSYGNTPVYITPFVMDIGHTAFVGPSMAGKSTGVRATVVGKLKNPRQLVVLLDSNYNCYPFTKSVGGIHIDISGESNKPMICPAARIGDGIAHRDRFQAWLEDTSALLLNSVLDPDEVAQARRAIDLFANDRKKSLTKFRLAVGAQAGREPRLWKVLDELGVDRDGNGLLAADTSLLPSRDGAEFGGSQLITIEVGNLAGSPRRLMPVLMSLFDWTEWLLNGDPFTMVADETHKFFREGRYAVRFERVGREYRKLNGALMVASQYYSDLAKGDLGELLGKAIKNWYFLPNADALTEECAEKFLTPTEQSLLTQLTPKRHYLFKNPDGVVPFSFELGPVELALIARESQQDIAKFREIEADVIAKNRAKGIEPEDPEFQDYTVPLWLEYCGVPNAQELGRKWVQGDPSWPKADGLRPRVVSHSPEAA